MLNLRTFNEENVQETVNRLLKKSDTIRIRGSHIHQIHTQTPAALVRMVRQCYPGCARKKNRIHPFVIAAIISKATHWHDWSVQTGVWKQEEGEFYKSRKSWEYEMDVSKYEIYAAEELLKNYQTLKTELRPHPTFNSKYWILNKQRLEEMYTVFAVMEALSSESTDKTASDSLFFVIEKAAKYAEESSFFRIGIGPLLAEFGVKLSKNEEGGVCCPTDDLVCPTDDLVCPTDDLVCPTDDTTVYKQETNNKDKQEITTTKVVEGRPQRAIPARPPYVGSHREVPSEGYVLLTLDGSSDPRNHAETPPKLRSTPPLNDHGQLLVDERKNGLVGTFSDEAPHKVRLDGKWVVYDSVEDQENEASETHPEDYSNSPTNEDGGPMPKMLSDAREGAKNRSYGLGGGIKHPRPQKGSQKRSKQIKVEVEELPFLKVVEAWNNLPPLKNDPHNRKLTKHSFDNSGYVNKTVKSILERLVIASKGKILEMYPSVKMWNAHTNFDHNVTTEEMNIASMIELIKVYRKYFEPGKGISDKSILKTSLHEFLGLYTVKTKTGEYFENRSWYWQILHKGITVDAVMNYEVYEQKLKQYSTAVHKFKAVLKDSDHWKPRWEPRITKIMARLLYTYERIYKNTYLLFRHTSKSHDWITLMNSFDTFMAGFTAFVAHQHENVYPGHFEPTNKMFRHFLEYGKSEVGVDLVPTKEVAKISQRNKAMRLYDADDIVRIDGVQVWYTEEEMEMINKGECNPWWALENYL